ncbi:tetratricopeptide repeat protein [Romeria aff. gracilis LEGE 07310]|uniref:Tetratricopeptide repeat protein n=1 Tax=Vasconcelosia minhoensis LEGE 07310 TaxID=915328 RepID=A0A8J7AJE8_9CYAN|nr:CD225/dispanin family protein [Romeria gracilis]MBE9080171.1 tetratricopeptide repeat protein [Romeria aff. gracilis LEGE 07310]
MSLPSQTWYRRQRAKLAYRQSLTLVRQAAPAAAIAAFERAIADHPEPSEVLVDCGLCRRQLGDSAGALADFEHAIAADHTHARAYANRGLLRYENGDQDGALTDWAEALRYRPGYADVRYSRALVYLSRQDYAAALEDLDQALVDSPNLAQAYLHRGNLRQLMGDRVGAIQDWELAVCNDFGLEQAKQQLSEAKQTAYDQQLTHLLQPILAEPDPEKLNIQVHHSGNRLDITIRRQLGTGINYYTLPAQIRQRLVPLQLAEVEKFQLYGYVADSTRPEWSQSYGLYKGQPCPPSNWQMALSALLVFPPFGIPALIYAAHVKKYYQSGCYIESLRASKTVKGLCLAGSATLCFLAMFPLGYAAFASIRELPPSLPQRVERPNSGP